MNTIQAKKIQIVDFLSNLGINPERKYHNFFWYKCPINNESNPSFKVNLDRNTWYNVATSQGGTIIDLAVAYFDCSVKEALEKIASISNHSSFSSTKQSNIKIEDKSFQLHAIKDLGNNQSLTNYVENVRKIPIDLARLYLKEIYYKQANNNKVYFAVGMPNMVKGYEVRNPHFKGTVGQKYLSKIDVITDHNQHTTLSIFEGFFDFLSSLAYFNINKPNNDSVILNSVAFLKDASLHALCYDSVSLLLDADNTGKVKSKEFIDLVPENFRSNVVDFSNIYADKGCKDFNELLQNVF